MKVQSSFSMLTHTHSPRFFLRFVVSWSESETRRPPESGIVDLAFKPQHVCNFWAWKPLYTPGIMSLTTPNNALQLLLLASQHSSSHDISSFFLKRHSCSCHSGQVQWLEVQLNIMVLKDKCLKASNKSVIVFGLYAADTAVSVN